MKLKNITSKISLLIRVQLAKFKVYKRERSLIKKKLKENYNLEYIEIHLKKALQIIYNYHFNKKRIFFIGFSTKMDQFYIELFKKTNHFFIPQNIWVKGILTNKVSVFKYINKEVNLKSKSMANIRPLFVFQQKPDLIVLFNNDTKSSTYQEIVKLRIPIISVNSISESDKQVLFPIYGNFQFFSKKFDNLFFFLLIAIIKKVKK